MFYELHVLSAHSSRGILVHSDGVSEQETRDDPGNSAVPNLFHLDSHIVLYEPLLEQVLAYSLFPLYLLSLLVAILASFILPTYLQAVMSALGHFSPGLTPSQFF
jgi:hypothetical protein